MQRTDADAGSSAGKGSRIGSSAGSASASRSSPLDELPASLQSPYPAVARPPTPQRPLHVVLASTGSVASVKIPLIVKALLGYANVRVQVIATDSSLHFYDRASVTALNGSEDQYTVASLAAENAAGRSAKFPRAHVWTTADEWSSFTRVGDPILHIELRRWADIVLVAPASANTLAKLNAGLCDDLLSCFLRACGKGKHVVLYPAMNTGMWLHPLTEVHVGMVQEVLGYEVRGPMEKVLACGDKGMGAMMEWTGVVGDVVGLYGLIRLDEGQGGR